MGKDNQVIRVGFICAYSNEWIAGLNYLYNLLYAISLLEDKKIKPVVFMGKKTDDKIKKKFMPLAEIVEHSMFDRKSLNWYIKRILEKYFNSSFCIERLIAKYQVQVLSHTNITNIKTCKIINWIPDFQHLHLPEMFSQAEVQSRNHLFNNIVSLSDIIIVSSQDAWNDLAKFAQSFIGKARILRFVAKPSERYQQLNQKDKTTIIKKYNLPDAFFYLPNQFWKHKNHLTVFAAVKILKNQGINVHVVCSGQMSDYRNPEHVDNLRNYIEQNNLKSQIWLLGMIEYEDVYTLIKFSKAVINPSLFEGWSSTVEECKSVNKPMILSDLSVHKEQYPAANFFMKDNPNDLANILKSFNDCVDQDFSFDWKEQSKKFAQEYENIILQLGK